MKEKLDYLGIIKAITQVRKMTMDRKPVDLEFLMSRWRTETHTFVTA